MSAILVIETDDPWWPELSDRLWMKGHLIQRVRDWPAAVSRLLRDRSALMVMPHQVPHLTPLELACFVRSRPAAGPGVVFRLAACRETHPELAELMRRTLHADAAIPADLPAEQAAEVIDGLAAAYSFGRRPDAPPDPAELVIVAGSPPRPDLVETLVGADLRVALASSLGGLAQLMAAIDHAGAVFVAEELLGEDPVAGVAFLLGAAPRASLVVLGAGTPPPRLEGTPNLRWLRAASPPLSVLAAAILNATPPPPTTPRPWLRPPRSRPPARPAA